MAGALGHVAPSEPRGTDRILAPRWTKAGSIDCKCGRQTYGGDERAGTGWYCAGCGWAAPVCRCPKVREPELRWVWVDAETGIPHWPAGVGSGMRLEDLDSMEPCDGFNVPLVGEAYPGEAFAVATFEVGK